ncbi:MAG: hypothetical protein ACRDVZ_15035 [Jiangellaceae bacterium]
MGNLIRVVVGLAGLIGGGWLLVRALRARRARRQGGEVAGSGSLVPAFAILTGTALVMALTVLLE